MFEFLINNVFDNPFCVIFSTVEKYLMQLRLQKPDCIVKLWLIIGQDSLLFIFPS